MPTLIAEVMTSERHVEAAVVLYRDWLGASLRVPLGRDTSPSARQPWAELHSTHRLFAFQHPPSANVEGLDRIWNGKPSFT